MNNQSGNVFVIILVTIALFAALIMTFTRTGQQGTGNMTEQQARIAAQDLMSFFNEVNSAVQKLRRKGCSVDDISFANSGDTGPFVSINDSATAPVDKSCHVFEPEGGKVTFNMNWTKYQIPYADIPSANQNQYGNVFFKHTNYAIIGIGSDTNEIAIGLNFVRKDICLAYNILLNAEIDYEEAIDSSPLGDTNTSLANQYNFCYYLDGNNHGQLNYVTIAR